LRETALEGEYIMVLKNPPLGLQVHNKADHKISYIACITRMAKAP
jgi:hypothetical protein